MYDVQLTDCGRDLLERITKGGKKTLAVEGDKAGEVDAGELVKREEEVLVSWFFPGVVERD